MTRETARIAAELRRAYDGDPWHGPSVRAVLEDVDVRVATARPAGGGHTICEIVAHMTAWTREAARRLASGIAQDPEEGDWPEVGDVDQSRWAAIVAALAAAHAELVARVESSSDAELDERIGDVRDRALGSGVSRYVLLHGLAQHHAYHAGQISLLKKTK